MRKEEYIKRLQDALKGVNKEDAKKLVDYYDELIDDAIEAGSLEDTFVDGLEPPELVAQNFKRESSQSESSDENKGRQKVRNGEEKITQSDKKETPVIIKILLGIACVVFAVAGVFVLGGIILSALSLVGYGVYAFIASFVLMGDHAGVAFAQMGYAFALIGAGLAILFVVPILARLYAFVVRTLSLQKPKEVTFSGKRALIACGSIFAVGLILFLISFGALGFSGKRLAAADDMVLRSQTIEVTDALTLVSDNLNLNIKYSDSDEIKFEYYEFEDNAKEYSYENGTIKLKSYGNMGSLSLIWRRGVFFSRFTSDYYDGALYLPQDLIIDLGVEINNGAISVENMSFNGLKFSAKNGAVKAVNCAASDVTVSTSNGAILLDNFTAVSIGVTTSNGAVLLKNCQADTLSSETSNGAVKLDKCTSKKVYCKTNHGAINLDKIVGDDIELKAGNGAINGTINGSQSDYKIESKTDNGSNNLSNKSDGTKSLKVKTGNGAIKITFTE